VFKPLRVFIEITLELSGSVLIDKFNGINFWCISFLLPIPTLNPLKRRKIVFHPSSLSCTSLDIDVIHLQTNSCKLTKKSLHIRGECQSALYDMAVDSSIVTDCCLVYTKCCILFNDTSKEATLNVYQFYICIEIYKK
jgi:hypothetical protein